MKHISSRENPVYKQIVRLAAGKRQTEIIGGHGNRHGRSFEIGAYEGTEAGGNQRRQYLLEGIHLCQAWLERKGQPDLALFDIERLESHPELAALANAVDRSKTLSCDTRLARALSDVEHGQGVFFITTPKVVEPPARIEQNSLWLDRVQDPGNVGVLLRTAAAAGIQHIYLSPGCAAAWSSKVLRSAQGAHFAASIYEQADLATANKKRDIPLLATALADATSLYEDTLPDQCVWLFGNEGQGVDTRLLDLADRRVFIPQAPNVESLNVAAAAAVCLFEHRRQRLAASR